MPDETKIQISKDLKYLLKVWLAKSRIDTYEEGIRKLIKIAEDSIKPKR